MDSSTLRSNVRQIVGEMSPLGAREAKSDDRLVEELGYDSLAVIELSLRIEQDFALDTEATGGTPDITTVKDIEDFVEARVAAPTDAA
ncbi:acyl carrier protein [Actinacidiphila sp. ITFR-21]|uniref:acyl carrier protein n=1 Tax=Actinacidiphila sp. ITFR-21 TaxID=3075199 RepID=UPI00288A44BD|nr:acyl carrier protein [Streptomyces sp. ITFR-21]WNI17998.1 acyl carrier protein [Streptomyces sp. ITFR-21]